jgi:hypothetical protein
MMSLREVQAALIRARQFRSNRLARFVEAQRLSRDWLHFGEIAAWCARQGNADIDLKPAKWRSAIDQLADSIINKEFDREGRSRVLFLHLDSLRARMTGTWLTYLREIWPFVGYDEPKGTTDVLREEYLKPCWISHDMCRRWLEARAMPLSPAWSRDVTDQTTLPSSKTSDRARDTNAQRREDHHAVFDVAVGTPARRARGKSPEKYTKSFEAMKADLKEGNLTTRKLNAMREKELLARYGTNFDIKSRDTVRKARKAILLEFEADSNADK